jgi:hypothetical protein
LIQVCGPPFWTSWRAKSLLDDNAIGPFDQPYKGCGGAEFRVPWSEVIFRDATRPATSPSSKDGNMFGSDFFERLTQRRPAYRENSGGSGFAHEIGGFTEKKDLNFVTGLAEG